MSKERACQNGSYRRLTEQKQHLGRFGRLTVCESSPSDSRIALRLDYQAPPRHLLGSTRLQVTPEALFYKHEKQIA